MRHLKITFADCLKKTKLSDVRKRSTICFILHRPFPFLATLRGNWKSIIKSVLQVKKLTSEWKRKRVLKQAPKSIGSDEVVEY